MLANVTISTYQRHLQLTGREGGYLPGIGNPVVDTAKKKKKISTAVNK